MESEGWVVVVEEKRHFVQTNPSRASSIVVIIRKSRLLFSIYLLLWISSCLTWRACALDRPCLLECLGLVGLGLSCHRRRYLAQKWCLLVRLA
jgi:hypothetical protein